MKKLFCILILLSLFTKSYGQLYDLIVTTESDSIACHIDSITDSYIFYEMKHSGNWINTKLVIEEVKEYKHDIIDKKKYIFKAGTSYINKLTSESKSIKNIQKNSMQAYLCLVSQEHSEVFAKMKKDTGKFMRKVEQ